MKPYAHQSEWLEKTKDLATFALFWDVGLGKSRTTIDTAAHLFAAGKIDALLIVAPNGVYPTWVLDQVPKHMPVEANASTFGWATKQAKTKKHTAEAAALLAHKGLAVLAMSYDSLTRTNMGKEFARKFLTQRRCLYVLDESARVKNPSSLRTKTVLASARYAPYRRILTGTPVDEVPFDVFAQVKFLDPAIWDAIGCKTFSAFKAHFGVWKTGYGNGLEYPELVAYRNLDVLKAVLQKVGSRLLKADVLDLPPQIYQRRYFDMTANQRRAYAQLRDECMTTLSGGAEVTAILAIVRLIRFQQITSGYLPADDDAFVCDLDLPGENPRLLLLQEVLEDLGKAKVIVWAKFRRDVDLILNLVRAGMGISAVRFDGAVGNDDRAAAIEAFQRGDAQLFVANPAVAGEGLTLTAAHNAVYYNNGYSLSQRLQSEGRPHRIGTTHPVVYVDLLAADTVDVPILDALREKRNIASLVTGDVLRSWI